MRPMRLLSRAARRPRGRAGFSLIEILISILILALGLLGLGALFPVVIRGQRQSVDATNGAFLVRRAEQALNDVGWHSGMPNSTGNLNPLRSRGLVLGVLLNPQALDDTPTYPITTSAGEPVNGMGEGYEGPTASHTNRPRQAFEHGEWYTRTVLNDPGLTAVERVGDAVLGLRGPSITVSTTPPTPPVPADRTYMRIPLRERVFPESGEPLYVWDFALQRIPAFVSKDVENRPTTDGLRAAVFVRRVDPRIRTGAESLRAAFFGVATPPADVRVPVGELAPGSDWMGFDPTFDGTDGAGGVRYSGIKATAVEFWHDPATPALAPRDRLYFPSAAPDPRWVPTENKKVFALLTQPGQRVVDNLGNVYTVVGAGSSQGVPTRDMDGDGTPGDFIRIDPPVPSWVTPEMARSGGSSGYTSANERTRRAIYQIAFTAQVPVAVQVVEVKK